MGRPPGSKNRAGSWENAPTHAAPTNLAPAYTGPALLPIRKLRQLVKEHGAPGADPFDRESLVTALENVGYEAQAPIPEQVEDYWTFANENVGRGDVYARDPQGNWSAVVRPDGSATFTKHVPSLNGRPGGVQFKDPTFEIPDLEAFAVAALLLVEGSDAILEASAIKLLQDAAAEQERLRQLEHVKPPEVDSTEWMKDRMYAMCPEWGFVDAHKPKVSDLPYRLAQAIGIADKDADGARKDWQTLAREVLGRTA